MVTRDEAETIAVQLASYPDHDASGKARLRAVAERKHQREAADFAEFATVDQAAYAERVAASVTRAAAGLEAAQAAAEAAEVQAREALQAERDAQDRVREHAEHSRQAQETWKRVQGKGTPREQTDALKDAQAAAQVLSGEQAAAEGKTAAAALADQELETARAKVTAAEAALQATRELAASPGRALYSPQTCAENVVHLVRIWDALQPVEQQLVKNAIRMLAMFTGLYDEIKAKSAAEREAELEGKQPQHGAFTLPSATAGVAGR